MLWEKALARPPLLMFRWAALRVLNVSNNIPVKANPPSPAFPNKNTESLHFPLPLQMQSAPWSSFTYNYVSCHSSSVSTQGGERPPPVPTHLVTYLNTVCLVDILFILRGLEESGKVSRDTHVQGKFRSWYFCASSSPGSLSWADIGLIALQNWLVSRWRLVAERTLRRPNTQ